MGDEGGDIKFLDKQFRLVRWTKTAYQLPIASFSFNLMSSVPEWKLEMSKGHYRFLTFVKKVNIL